MKSISTITSAKFVKGIVAADPMLEDGTPQVAFIGRSNVGKSSVINSLTKQPGLARTSSFPGRTSEINLFIINKELYLLDLPGYGFAEASKEAREKLRKLIRWYLFETPYRQKRVVLIIDAYVGPTDADLEMIVELEEHDKNVLIVANKVDKMKSSEYKTKMQKIQNKLGFREVIPYSAEKKVGIKELTKEILM